MNPEGHYRVVGIVAQREPDKEPDNPVGTLLGLGFLALVLCAAAPEVAFLLIILVILWGIDRKKEATND